MPKQTFFNLPEEKRRTIEQAALDEFAECGFDNSNINRILEESNIPKGSFYQYFEDKKDLYFHMLDTLVTRKMNVMEHALNAVRQNTFVVNVEEIFRVGLEFADSDPKFYMLGEDFANKQPSFIKEFTEKYSPMATDIYGKLLEHALETGELQEGLNVPLTSSFINALVNQTTVGIIRQGLPKEQRNFVIAELLGFIKRAVTKSQ